MRLVKTTLIFSAVLFAVSCASQPIVEIPPGAPGFFFGLLHGATALFALVGSFFADVRIYSFPNSGCPYDLGYVIGAGFFLAASGVQLEMVSTTWTRTLLLNY
jgi:hypothetical protein